MERKEAVEMNGEYVISDDEAKNLAELYNDIQDKRCSFEEYLENYKREQVDKILKEEKGKCDEEAKRNSAS